MAAWNYDYQVGAVNLADYCSAVIVDDEASSGLVGSNVRVPGVDGERRTSKSFGAKVLPLRTVLRWTNSSGAVTHANGEAGHIKENLSALKRLLGGANVVDLNRIDPHAGLVHANVELIGEPVRGESRQVYIWPLNMVEGSWYEDTLRTQAGTPPTVVTLGDRRVDILELEFAAAGTVTHTAVDGTVSTVQALAGSFPLIVFTGPNKRVTQGGSPAPGRIVPSQQWWMRLDGGVANSIASTSAVTFRWRNRWA